MAKHAQELHLEVDEKDMLKKFNRFQTIAPNYIRAALIESMNLVGMTSVQDFMQAHAVEAEEYTQRPSRGKLAGRRGGAKIGILTGRLSRSILNQHSEFGNEGIRRTYIKGKTIEAHIGSNVPYAAIHEYGGQAGPGRSVTIPARPYLKPAAEKAEPGMTLILKNKMEALALMESDV